MLPDFNVLNIGYARTTHHWGGRDLSSPFARLYYVKQGSATLRLPHGEALRTRPSHMYLVPPYQPHDYLCEPGFEFYYIFLTAPEGTLFGEGGVLPLEVEANTAADLLFTHYCHLYPKLSLPYASADDFNAHPAYGDYLRRYRAMDPYEQLQLQGLAAILLSYFVKHRQPPVTPADERVARLTQHIRQHPAENHTLQAMADEACLGVTQLTRLFHAAYHLTPIQYVLRNKVQAAQRLLLTTDRTVSDIAQELGFSTTTYFVRTFKKVLGLPPQLYRKSLRY